MGDDGVDGGGVVLDGLADPPGGGRGEPGQRGAGDALDDVAAHLVPQGEVGHMGDEQGHHVQEQARGVGADEHHDDGAHALRVGGGAGVVGVQEDVSEPDQGEVGRDGEDAREQDQDLPYPQPGAHGRAESLDGRLPLTGAPLPGGLAVRDLRAVRAA